MGRAGLARTVSVALLCLLAGCSAAGRTNPLSALGGAAAKKNAESQTVDTNPFRPAKRAGSGEDAQSQGGDAIQHDRETLQLIARELRDVDPEERQILLEQLKQTPAEAVPAILKFWRMSKELQQQRHQAAAAEPPTGRPTRGLGAFPGSGAPAAQQAGPIEPAGFTARADNGRFARRRDLGDSATGQDADNDADLLPEIRPSGTSGRETVSGAGDRSLPFSQPDAGHGRFQPGNDPSFAVSANRPAKGDEAAAGSEPSHAAAVRSSSARPNRDEPTGRPVGLGTPQFGQTSESAAWQEALQQTIAAAETQAREARSQWEQAEAAANTADPSQTAELQRLREKYVRRQVFLRMLYLMAGRDAQALDRIPGLDPADQEFWTQALWAITNYFDYQGIPRAEDRATQTVAELRSAVWRLQEKARLQIRNVSFCRRISSYGNYETFARDEFRRKQPVLVYAEIENFSSDQGSDGTYRTQLKSTIEIHKAGPQGGLVKRIEFPATTDTCRNHRRDYFHSYEIQIPASATLGPHVLKLMVEDELSKKVASYSRNFTVVDGG